MRGTRPANAIQAVPEVPQFETQTPEYPFVSVVAIITALPDEFIFVSVNCVVPVVGSFGMGFA
jgi:hypothetical protein